MDPTMQQAVSEDTNGTNDAAVNGLATEMENVTLDAAAAPVPTYDQQFPSLGGGADNSKPAAPFGSWNAKPRVQSSTITQVCCRVFLRRTLDKVSVF